MRQKLKGLLIAFCMVLAAAAFLPGTVKAEGISGASESDQATLESFLQQMVEKVTAMTEEQMDSILTPSSILTAPDKFNVSAVESWNNAREETGAFKSTKDTKVEVTDESIIVSTVAVCEKTSANVVLTISRETVTPESMVFEVGTETTLAGKMKEAGLNTIMGLAVVFLMLFFLSWLISLFKNLNKIGNKKQQVLTEKMEQDAQVIENDFEEEELADDNELAAVIAAAIAASENVPVDGFVVRSIRKSKNRKWQRA